MFANYLQMRFIVFRYFSLIKKFILRMPTKFELTFKIVALEYRKFVFIKTCAEKRTKCTKVLVDFKLQFSNLAHKQRSMKRVLDI